METTRMVHRLIFLICAFTSVAAAQSAPHRKDIPAIAKAANGSVVSIVMSDKDGKPISQGSGFFVTKDGLVVTNYHVICEGSSAVVKLPDGAFYVVDGVLTADKTRDIAIIKAHGQNFPTLTVGNSDRVQVGEEIVAIGNPLGLELTVSNGIVSGVRTVEEAGGKFLQITAPISHGSSGGPLFNMSGQVVGITSMGLEKGQNLNFAIPVNDAKPLLSKRNVTLSGFPDETEETAPNKTDPSENPKQATLLQKDVSWMNRFLSEHSEVGMRFGIQITQPEVRDAFNKIMHDELSGREDCVVSVHRNTDGVEWTILASLTDIDPAKIEVFGHDGTTPMVQFITLHEQPKMIIGRPRDDTFTPAANNNFLFDSLNSAEEFRRVFKHAVAICDSQGDTPASQNKSDLPISEYKPQRIRCSSSNLMSSDAVLNEGKWGQPQGTEEKIKVIDTWQISCAPTLSNTERNADTLVNAVKQKCGSSRVTLACVNSAALDVESDLEWDEPKK